MDVLMIYVYIAASLVAFLLVQRYLVRGVRYVINPRLIYLFSKHLILPYIFRRRRFWGPITRFDAITRTIYFAGTFACNIAGVAILILSLTVLPWMRRWCYELFTKLHCLLSLFVVVTAWLHLKQRFGFDGICLIISVGLFLLNSVICVLCQTFRNVVAGQQFAVSDVIKHKDAVELTFRPPRPWRARAGQYVYITAPGLRPLSFAESHPFTVIWWECDPDGKVINISLLAKAETGFSRALYTSPYSRLRILIDGPYGESLNIQGYTSVVAVATGIGIAGQLPYVKEFVERRLPQTTGRQASHNKRILLIWRLQEEYHEDWIVEWMDKLLDEDEKSMALSYSLYIMNKSQKEYQEGEKVRISRRGTVFYGKPDLEGIIHRELAMSNGRMLLTVSADPDTRDEIRRYVIDSDGIDLHEADYQPHGEKGGFWALQKPVNHFGIA
ncbi:FAD-binding domain protein [Aspergillus affinis]|uniref:FAD-binding domain protein n=1 Tax=Aspergillus affinis TaxID=1070780 RepID=UPI0022FE6CD0|nr:FAD-binding domain protein [Aspergillus affinis]KAI9037210.1 FAD-binding domain protein [Aspergillus affinis]